ncbi:MAG: ligase-associated DNA damage response endonuclease PdeM [Rhodobacteraceae bacterium]|nr:ligase-associated DNA damage response endonuclease PdeM [Paracoccaceae bacterium]
MSIDFTLGTARLTALPSGALHWPDARLLCVSDLHFGKSERLARRGGPLLPPYETRATLLRLEADLEATGARCVVCLGDSFDDLAAADGLDEADRLWLTRLMAGREWVWIMGNHDAGPANLGGSHLAEFLRAGLVFRHIGGGSGPEVSGHFHPKVRLAGKAWRAFLADKDRLILPAYGTFTGGLWAEDPALQPLMGPGARAFVTLADKCVAIPMPRPSLRRG